MDKVRSFTKVALHKIALFWLANFMFFGIMTFVLAGALGDRATPKQWLIEADTYSNFVENGFSLVSRQDVDKSISEELAASALDGDALQKSITDVYSPVYLQEKFELFIDGTYDFLEGSTETLDVVIDLNEQAPQLTKSLSTELAQQLARLPSCSLEEIPQEFDVFTATCLPNGADIVAFANSITADVVGDSEGAEPLIDGPELVSNNAALQAAPGQYQNLIKINTYLPWALATLGVIILLTGKNLMFSVRSLSRSIFFPSVTALVTFVIIGRFTSIDLFGSDQPIIQLVFQPFLAVATNDISSRGIIPSLLLIVASALSWLAIFLVHRQHAYNEKYQSKMIPSHELRAQVREINRKHMGLRNRGE